jgi:ubiquitin-protein ligase
MTSKVPEFMAFTPQGRIKEFKKGGTNSGMYEIIVERDKFYEFKANIEVPSDYPESPPTFKLSMLKF